MSTNPNPFRCGPVIRGHGVTTEHDSLSDAMDHLRARGRGHVVWRNTTKGRYVLTYHTMMRRGTLAVVRDSVDVIIADMTDV